MAITLEKYLELAEMARQDKSLHQNHLATVIKALKKRKTHNSALMEKLDGNNAEDGVLSQLEEENRLIDHALTAYD